MSEVNGYTHLALSCLYCMATKEGRPKNEVRLIASIMQKILDMDRELRKQTSGEEQA